MKSKFLKNKENAARESIRLNRKVVTFLACLLLSILFWLLMSLSKDYTIAVSYPVEYVNTPKDKVISNLLPQRLDIEIKARGFFLLAYKFRKAQTVLIDLGDSKPTGTKNYYYLQTNASIDKITDQFSSRIVVQRVIPDTIFLNFNRKAFKHVPVKANIALSIDEQYQQSDSIKLEPAFVDISGASDLLAKVNYIETLPLVVKKMNQSKTFTLQLLKNTEWGEVELSQNQVKALIKVQKYTESSIDLPIEAINLPAGYTLKSFPDKVNVKFNVAFDSYGKVNASQFRAIIDYKKAESNSNKLKIQLERFPSEIRSVKLNPEKVEYIIKK